MRIAMVFDGLGYGGITTVGLHYISILQELGHDVDIYNLKKFSLKEKDLPYNCKLYHKNFNVWICPEKYSGGVKRYSWGKFAYPLLFIVLYFIIKLAKLFYRNNRKYDVVIAFSGHWNDLTFVANNFINAKFRIAWLHGSLYQYLLMSSGYLSLYKKIKNLVVLDDEVQREALVYNRFAKLNIKVLANPTYILNKKIDTKKVNLLKNKYGEFWIMVALLMQPKDHSTFLKAIKRLKDQYLYMPKVLFLGDGPNKNIIMQEIEQLGLKNQVFLLGNVDDIENYYYACFGVVHSSQFEGFGMAVVEAISFGKPVIATDCAFPIRKIIRDNNTGFLCNVGDFDAIAEKMFKLYNDKAIYDYFSENGKEYAKNFSPLKIKNELKKFLENLDEN